LTPIDRRRAAWLTAAALVPAGAAVAVPGPAGPRPAAVHVDGPPTAHTGARGEPTCRACHLGAELNPPGGTLSLDGWPDVYDPGRRYLLEVVLDSEEMGAAGFGLAVRFEDGTAAGRLEAVDDRVAVTPDSVTAVPYAHHTRDGTEVADPARASWTVAWTAPGEATAGGTLTAAAAANSANGDDSPFDDFIYAVTWPGAPATQGRPADVGSGASRR
jgi:hypothetical protein